LNYFSVVGTKVVNFNSDSSPFKNLRDLIGAKADEMLNKINE